MLCLTNRIHVNFSFHIQFVWGSWYLGRKDGGNNFLQHATKFTRSLDVTSQQPLIKVYVFRSRKNLGIS